MKEEFERFVEEKRFQKLRENAIIIQKNVRFLTYDTLNILKICFRSSRAEVFCKKGIFRNFAKVIGKHLCQSLFFNKFSG